MPDANHSLVSRLLERRVPQIFAIYLGGCWALVEFADFMVEEFLLSPHWTRVALVGSLLLVPSVVMLAWYHGKPGRDRMAQAEKIGIPANVALCVTVLWGLFGGSDLGAATTAVTVETEEGEVVERVVAKAEFRKRTALFPLEEGTGIDPDESWVAYAVRFALEIDLLADDFFQSVPLAAVIEELRGHGVDDPRDVPAALRREVAEGQYAEFLVAGSIDRADDRYRVVLRLHRVSDGSLAEEAVYEGTDLLALVDEMSSALKAALDIPAREGIEDLPVRERLTGEPAAWKEYVLGMSTLLVQDDLTAAIEHMSAAAQLDPTFTAAHWVRSSLLISDNRQEEALIAIQAAMEHLYRLPERMGFVIKADYYFLADQLERMAAVSKMWVDLYPGDVDALRQYLFPLQVRGDWAGVLATLNEIRRLTPRDAGVLRDIAAVQEQLGDEEAALASLAEYVAQRPDDHSGYQSLAAIRYRRGELDIARENLERAILIQPLLPELTTGLADLDLVMGRFDEALAGYRSALELTRSPQQRAEVLRRLAGYFRFRGEMDSAIQTLDDWLDEATGASAPVAITQARYPDIDLFFAAGRNEEAVALFEELSAQLAPPLSEFYVPHWAVHVALGLEDYAAARETHARALEAVEANQLDALVPELTGDLGRIQEAEGDYPSASASYENAMDEDPALDLRWRLSRALRMQGRLAEAEAVLNEGLRSRPASPQLHLQMAYLLEAMGDVPAAVEHLRTALAAWANADDAYEPAREAREKLAELEG